MSNHYATSLLVEQRHLELQNEAAQDRLARLARSGRTDQPHWWRRLMPFRSRVLDGTPASEGSAPRRASHRPTATAAAGDSPC